MSKVINIATQKPRLDYIYIGRISNSDYHYGNPFIIGRDGDRETVIKKYRKWLTTDNNYRLRQKKYILMNLNKLKDKNLGCYCAPLPCHGDVLIELLNKKEG